MAGRLRLQVTDRGRPRTPLPFLRKVVAATLRHLRQPGMAVSLLLTDDAEIGRLHAQFLGDATPTDVISFGLDGGAELVVSVDTARRCARRHRHPIRHEVALYVVHGLLHIGGHDDQRPRARARMRRAERAVMQSLALRFAAVD